LKGRFHLKNILAIAATVAAPMSKAENAKTENDQAWTCLTEQVVELGRDTDLLAAVNNYNSNPPDPIQLDKIWPTLDKSTEIIENLTQTPAARSMREWINAISIQGEGLLIGKNGGLVASTDKTSDFWQGDEAQFLQAITLPESQVHIQREMLDESTNMMLLKVSAPIYNPRSNHAIGVLVIGFDQFVIDFNQPCELDYH